MLPPPAGTRQNSYAYNLPRPSRSRAPSSIHIPLHSRSTSHTNPWAILPGPPGTASPTQALSSHRTPSHQRGASGQGFPWTAAKDEDSEADEEEELRREMDENDADERGLEETLEKLGFGAYHWRLLALCGFGWMSDNSALQCIAVILPRVQVHFDLTSEVVGLLSASTMAGMMIGAVGWGTVSDILGRSLPFNATLFLTAVFGIGASFSPSFPILCIWMFFLGSAVGGSMPTDGTLFLENLPYSKQYLLTLLSVFFSLGAVLSSTVSYIFLPGASCRVFEGCDIAGKANDGWRKVLLVLGLFNLVCSFMRWGLFRLQESPRYLVAHGREDEAVIALQAIATYNDRPMDISSEDVQGAESDPAPESVPMRDKKNSELPTPDPLYYGESETSPLPDFGDGGSSPNTSRSGSRASGLRYDAIGNGPAPPPRQTPLRTGSAFYAPTPGIEDVEDGLARQVRRSIEEVEGLMDGEELANEKRGWRDWGRDRNWMSWWDSWVKQISRLFVPQWRRTVILMWIIWGSMSFAYTMFNVWLPAVLESRAKGEGDEAIKQALQEFVLYSAAGCPGSIVGAWMIQTRLGRRKSLAICTILTSLSTFAFIRVEQDWAVIVSSMFISAAATAMYAVLYGMTPETFGTSIRGTACGTSAALSRLTGVVAPVSAGFLLAVSPNFPVFTSAAIFALTAGCSLLLPFERVAEGKTKGMAVAGH